MRLGRVNVCLLGAALQAVPAAAGACSWSDDTGDLRIESGLCTFSEIGQSETIEVDDRIALATETIRVARGATLVIDDTEIDQLRLLSTPETSTHLIAEAGTLRIRNVVIESYDPETDGPDMNMEDGRSFVRVDGFVDDTGQAANGRLEINGSRLSYLGYDSRFVETSEFSSYGISLKVRSEDALRRATVTGHIRNSSLSYNYRGFYSYGAEDFEISDSEVHHNDDYGIDGHDDTDRLIVTGNRVFSNGGTGLICSRRCGANVFRDNEVHDNGANGIVLHDISTGGRILNNRVFDNVQDGIVVHDSQDTLVAGNEIRGNRYGVRVFSGSVLTAVTDNLFGENTVADIFIKHGNLQSETDLSDYSHGPDWNAQNIARHNSSGVWGTEIVRNRFMAEAKVLARGANYLRFAENIYTEGVSFDIQMSDNIELDGVQSEGHVSYLLRGELHAGADYSVAAPPGAELSMNAMDRVTLRGSDPLIPDGRGFLLRLGASEPRLLTLDLPNPTDIRTAVLVDLPMVPIAGFASIYDYRDNFLSGRFVSMRISVPPGNQIVLRVLDRVCSVVEWKLNDRVFISAALENVELNGPELADLTLTCLATARG